MEIKFLGEFKNEIGCKSITLNHEKREKITDLEDIINHLKREEEFADKINLKNKNYFILLNGRNIEDMNGFQTEVKEGDKIVVSSSLAGG